MAKYSDVIAGLHVFMEHEGDRHYVSAEHDVIYAGFDVDNLTTDQLAILEEAGWHIDEETGGWARFV